MTRQADWQDAAARLAAKVTANAPEWHEPVSITPRNALVPRWWERDPGSPYEEWDLVAPEMGSAAHLAATFGDSTLVTRVGPKHADYAETGTRAQGSPTSSSTLPGLIVLMLSRLAPQAGSAVLDVGTGVGYSAALLGHRLGDEHVTSIDVDPYLVEAARARLASFGRKPRIEAVDATGGLPSTAYDRIVATVSARPIPRSWITALQPGGRIVTTIARTGCLLSADMGSDGVARGGVLPEYANFMVTRRERDYPPRLQDLYQVARDSDGSDIRTTTDTVPELWKDWQFQSLFELAVPDVERRQAALPDGRQLVWLLARDGSWSRAEALEGKPVTVHQSGPRRLWDQLESVRTKWREQGCFPLRDMTVKLGPSGSAITAPNGSWSFPL